MEIWRYGEGVQWERGDAGGEEIGSKAMSKEVMKLDEGRSERIR